MNILRNNKGFVWVFGCVMLLVLMFVIAPLFLYVWWHNANGGHDQLAASAFAASPAAPVSLPDPPTILLLASALVVVGMARKVTP